MTTTGIGANDGHGRWRYGRAALMAAVAGLVLTLLPASGLAAGHDPPPTTAPLSAPGDDLDCYPLPDPDGNEPVCNPHLAQTAWSANHRTSYTQGSSPLPGLTGPPAHVNVHHEGLPAVPIVLTFSPPYPDGSYVVWGSTIGFTGEVFKLDPETFAIIDEYRPAFEDGEGMQQASPSGAYNVLDRDNHLIVARGTGLEVYGDDPSDRMSRINLFHRLEVPEEVMCRPDEDDTLVGITMTYDGHVVFATRLGIVGVVPRWIDHMTTDEMRTFSINGERCDDDSVDEEELEEIANTLAADEDGGIYVQTSKQTWRVDWDAQQLTPAWSVPYTDDRVGEGGRLGRGSNSSASVMGKDPDEDRFVVVYDNAEIFNVVYLWRDEIPAGWEPPGGEPDRVACKVRADFGRDDDEAWSEQSVLVRGYGALVVNDRMSAAPLFEQTPNEFGGFWQVTGGVPGNEPRGMQRVDWDPATRTCATTWTNPEVAVPNTIPTMSADTGLVYAIGVRDGEWGLEVLDWETGEEVLFVSSSHHPKQNSLWAATQVGPDESVWSGTFGGVTRWSPCDPEADEVCGKRLDPLTATIGEELTIADQDDRDRPERRDADRRRDDDDGDEGATAAPSDDERTLPATGGGADLLGLSLIAAAALSRRRPRA